MDKRLQTACEVFSNTLAVRVFRGFHWRDCADFRLTGLCSSFSRVLLVERALRGDGGTLLQHSPQRSIKLRPGHAYLIPGGVRFDLFYRRGLVMYSTYLHLDGPFGDDLIGTVTTIGVQPLSREQRALIDRLAERRISIGDALLFRNVLIAAFAPLVTLRMHEVATRNRLAERYTELLSELERMLPARASVNLLARRLNQSAGTLAKRFSRDVGITLKDFLLDRLRLRMIEALEKPTGTIADIAAALGFSDQFYFSRCCKRMTGLSPRAYRLRLPAPTDDVPVG